jgi:hypothetical protein
MDEREIKIEIGPDGTVNMDMQCFTGGACDEVFKKLARQIGTVVSTQKKQEYYEESPKVRIADEE